MIASNPQPLLKPLPDRVAVKLAAMENCGVLVVVWQNLEVEYIQLQHSPILLAKLELN